MHQRPAHLLQAEAHPGDVGAGWPGQFSHLLSSIAKDSQTRKEAESFFLGLLHPDPTQRVTAAQALGHRFLVPY